MKWRETVSGGGVATKADDNEGTSGRITDNTYTIGRLKGDTEYTITVTLVNPLGNMTSQLIIFTNKNGNKYTAISYAHVQHTVVEVKAVNNTGIQTVVTPPLLLYVSNRNSDTLAS